MHTSVIHSGTGTTSSLTGADLLARKTILSNGLTVIVSEKNQIPTIHLQVMIRAGSTQDPPHLLGLADITAELLIQGTTQKSAMQISQEIESVGGSLSATCESDFAAVNLSILKKLHIWLAVDLAIFAKNINFIHGK